MSDNWGSTPGVPSTGGWTKPDKEKQPALPGSLNLDVGSIGGLASSSAENTKQSGDFINGLGQFLFGEKNGSLLGGVPGVGQAVRAASAVPGVKLLSDVTGQAAGLGVGAVVGGLQHVPLGWLPGGTDQTFDSLPHDEAWQAVNAAANDDILGGGNAKFDYVQKFLEDQQANIKDSSGFATLDPGLLAGPGGSLWQLAGQAMGLAQLPQRYVERGLAGTGKALSGMNRVQETLARAESGATDLSPVELAVVQKVGDGSWTEDRALDFLSSHGAGLSHDHVLQMVGSFATDPTVVASLGSGGLAKLSAKGASILETGQAAVGRYQKLAVAANGLSSGEMGSVAKVARSIIDPLSAIGGHGPASAATVDLYSSNVATRAFFDAHGPMTSADVFHAASDLGIDPDLIVKAGGGRGATVSRDILAQEKQAQIIDGVIEQYGTPADAVKGMMSKAPHDIEQRTREQIFLNRQGYLLTAPEQRAELARQVVVAFGGDAEGLAARIGKANDAELGLWHDLLYAADEGGFRRAADEGSLMYTGKVPYNRLNMMNQSTLTDLGAKGFMERISALPDDPQAALAELADMQAKYPAMKKYGKNVQYAMDDLKRQLELGDHSTLPHQVVDAEMAQMPETVREFFEGHPHRTLGFRPPDDVLWNIERNDDTGLLERGGSAWTEHVHEGVAYRPAQQLPFNLAGQVLPVRGAVKALDWLEAGPRVLRARISTTVIRENARQRFIARATKDGMTEGKARQVFQALTEHLDTVDKPAVWALKPSEIWKVVEPLLKAGDFATPMTKRDALRWVVQAFEGDLSMVGLAQKIPNKLRTKIAAASGYESNFMGQLSGDLYNELRFRGPTAVAFKGQEAIEPFALNSMAGVGMSGKASVADRELHAAMNETSLLRQMDRTDLMEQSPFALREKALTNNLSDVRGRLQKVLNPNLPLLKRIGQTRMMENRLGPAWRKSFEDAGQIEDWLAFKQHYSGIAGRPLSDSEVAQRLFVESTSSALDIGLDYAAKPGDKLMNFDNLFQEQQMWAPASVGRLTPLKLNAMSKRLTSLKGKEIGGIKDLIKELEAGVNDPNGLKLDDVMQALRDIGAPDEYVNRVNAALTFNYGDFWAKAVKGFKMSPAESRKMQDWVAAVAKSQDMQPAEFLSQVVSSGIRQTWGKDEVERAMAQGINLLRAKRGATPEALAQQLADAFIGHVHPSQREHLLGRFSDDLRPAINEAMVSGDTAKSVELQGIRTSLEGAVGGVIKDEAAGKRFSEAVLERARTGIPDADPNVENAFRYFSNWSQKTLAELGHSKNPLATLVKSIPTNGVPFDHTQGALIDALSQRLKDLEKDTYRMQYFARDRSLLERSINHPFFGLYPASYMWFKIMPQMVRFIAKEPFGMRTGALAYALNDIQTDVAIQREFDPEFGKMLDGADKNALLWFLGYMLPATPWSIPASAPSWLRDLSGQGLAAEARAKQGKPATGIDFWSPISRVGDYISPIRSADQFNRVGKDLGNTLFGSKKEQKQRPGQAGLTAQVAAPAQQLAEPLGDAMSELEASLSKIGQ